MISFSRPWQNESSFATFSFRLTQYCSRVGKSGWDICDISSSPPWFSRESHGCILSIIASMGSSAISAQARIVTDELRSWWKTCSTSTNPNFKSLAESLLYLRIWAYSFFAVFVSTHPGTTSGNFPKLTIMASGFKLND